MTAKVHDLMTENVLTVEPDATIDRVRRIFKRNKVGAVPVVGSDGEPVGIVSKSDLVDELDGTARVDSIMTQKVYVVPRYDDVSIAARIMRNHKIHRLVVTHEKKVVGVITAFDLLALVQDHRWVPKNPPSASRKSQRSKKV